MVFTAKIEDLEIRGKEAKEIVNVLREHMANHPTDEMTSAKRLFAILDNALDLM